MKGLEIIHSGRNERFSIEFHAILTFSLAFDFLRAKRIFVEVARNNENWRRIKGIKTAASTQSAAIKFSRGGNHRSPPIESFQIRREEDRSFLSEFARLKGF